MNQTNKVCEMWMVDVEPRDSYEEMCIDEHKTKQ